MPLDSIAISFAVVAMFASLMVALAWGVHQSGEYDELLQTSGSDEAKFKKEISINLSAAWECL